MSLGTEQHENLLEELVGGRNLSQQQAHQLMGQVMQGAISPPLLAGILVALRTKGETVEEITGLALAMRENATAVKPQRANLIDTCGTGGDGSGTFNISTTTALVAAAMGCGVAKHGNRAASSACGSADVLEFLGVNMSLSATEVAHLVDTIGFGFMYAPTLHPAMKNATPARRELGIRTVFNILGPLTNPAGATRQLLGVFDPALCSTMAEVLGALGSEKAFVVHGAGHLDEVSLLGPTQVACLDKGQVETFVFHPRDVGMELCQPADIKGGTVAQNAAIIQGILAGEPGPASDVVVLNAAFVAVLADRAPDFRAGVSLARQALADGSANRLLRQLIEQSSAKAGGKA